MEFGTLTIEHWELHPDQCLQELNKEENWQKVPLLNNETADINVKEGQLVRFHGMVQDMFDPQHSVLQYEVLNTHTNQKEIRSAKYRHDLRFDKDCEEILFHSEKTTTEERRLIYCVSVPGLNTWVQVKTEYKTGGCLSTVSRKCNVEEDSMPMEEGNQCLESAPLPKRFCDGINNSNLQESELIAHSQGKACLIYLYDTEGGAVTMNEVVDVAGFLSLDNSLANDFVNGIPLPPLVCTLHAVHIKKVQCCNPLVKQVNIDELWMNGPRLREELKLILTQVLLGDDLAADYLICHLLSTVYTRDECFVLGKFPLNIFNIPASPPCYVDLLYDFLSYLVTKSQLLPMSLAVMNSTNMIPKKNYETNCLETGLLQLSRNTHLVVDETKLQAGVMYSKGLQNLKALNDLIAHQTVNYDFKFYPLEFRTDIRVLILSEGKTMLHGNYCLPLRPQETYMSSIEDTFKAAKHYLSEPLLSQLRAYLSIITPVQFHFTDELQQIIEEDFVNMRQEFPNTTADDLHTQLVIARLLCVSNGTRVSSREYWNAAKTMESRRKARIDASSTRNSN